MTDIKPALTSALWEDFGNGKKVGTGDGYTAVEQHPTRAGLLNISFADGSYISLYPDARHGVAALCLHNQEYGFDHEDLRLLISAAYEFGLRSQTDFAAALHRIANKVEALLPPRE